MADSVFASALANDRGDQAAGNGDRNTHIGMLVHHHVFIGPGDIGVRHIAQGKRQRLDDHVIDRKLVDRLVVFHGRGRVELRRASSSSASSSQSTDT